MIKSIGFNRVTKSNKKNQKTRFNAGYKPTRDKGSVKIVTHS